MNINSDFFAYNANFDLFSIILLCEILTLLDPSGQYHKLTIPYLEEQHEAHPLVIRVVLLGRFIVEVVRHSRMRHLHSNL